MRVVAIGGSGGMGRYAVWTVLRLGEIDEVVIADRNEAAAATLVEQLADGRVRAVGVDVADTKSLRRAVEGADVVMNTAGPFFRFGVPVLKASIAAGAHYLDICDDWEPTLDMLELGAEAERAGITAVVGLGASPGVSNLLAVMAMSELDEVDTVITGWGVGRGVVTGGEPSAAVVHWVHQCVGPIRILREGALVDARPLQPVVIDYPDAGQAAVWTVGHPEPVTLSRARPDLRNSMNVMVAAPWIVEAMQSLAEDVQAGRLTVEGAAARLVSGDAGRGEGEEPDDTPDLPPLFAYATGRKGSATIRVAATVAAMPKRGMGGATGVPLGVGVRLLLDGRLSRPGVFAPEEIVEPLGFFGELARRCDPPRSGAAELVVVTTA